MIKMLRVDERLIHGQVAIAWSKVLTVTSIVVANDTAAEDEMIKMTLKMATPQGMKVAIKTVDDAIVLLNDPRCEKMSILIVVDCPKDALKIAKAVPNIPLVNIGNSGRLGDKATDRKMLSDGLFVNSEEVQILKEIIATGIETEVRMVPERPKLSLSALLEKF
ncbi:PTS sugar transporter subunit IIB [Hydrogenoanaerobacterium sp.]|uniref:PTS sugar transporter subunit IIB n=1 Tax=Hydrogenoanaerobacterium sp. TaxID=2953763 RepID=UPI0028976C7F|nr:PTS sugar transporter subunit IIB [Hydrogenoanaerobacterium sp.]